MLCKTRSSAIHIIEELSSSIYQNPIRMDSPLATSILLHWPHPHATSVPRSMKASLMDWLLWILSQWGKDKSDRPQQEYGHMQLCDESSWVARCMLTEESFPCSIENCDHTGRIVHWGKHRPRDSSNDKQRLLNPVISMLLKYLTCCMIRCVYHIVSSVWYCRVQCQEVLLDHASIMATIMSGLTHSKQTAKFEEWIISLVSSASITRHVHKGKLMS